MRIWRLGKTGRESGRGLKLLIMILMSIAPIINLLCFLLAFTSLYRPTPSNRLTFPRPYLHFGFDPKFHHIHRQAGTYNFPGWWKFSRFDSNGIMEHMLLSLPTPDGWHSSVYNFPQITSRRESSGFSLFLAYTQKRNFQNVTLQGNTPPFFWETNFDQMLAWLDFKGDCSLSLIKLLSFLFNFIFFYQRRKLFCL